MLRFMARTLCQSSYSTTRLIGLREWLVLTLTLVSTVATAQQPYTPGDGDHQVLTWEGQWVDASRSRTVPVKIYYPAADGGQPAPVIVFSHGLGGSCSTYSYLGKYWAAHGYVSVHVQHAGSDTLTLWQGKLRDALLDPSNYSNRPKDISFAIDELTRLAKDPSFPLHGRMNLQQIGVAGHSFGAYTVLAVSGQAVGSGRSTRYYGPDPRIKAGIAMSSDAARTANLNEAYRRITIPIFHMTGTRDQVGAGAHVDQAALIGHATPADRRVAYDHTTRATAYLLTFNDGDHMVFSGRLQRTSPINDKALQKIICIASTAFWDANLKQDVSAKRWLEQGGFPALLGGFGTFEQKHPSAKE